MSVRCYKRVPLLVKAGVDRARGEGGLGGAGAGAGAGLLRGGGVRAALQRVRAQQRVQLALRHAGDARRLSA